MSFLIYDWDFLNKKNVLEKPVYLFFGWKENSIHNEMQVR